MKVRTSFLKIKHFRLITPEYAEELRVPAECPVLCSPYIKAQNYCHICHVAYRPLVYQIGHTTEAHHFCATNGGGIYVQLYEDHTDKWHYEHGLFSALVHPHGPIRMGNDRGYQFRSITPQSIQKTTCYTCHAPIFEGVLVKCPSPTLKAVCLSCFKVHAGANQTDWSFQIRDGELSFSRRTSLILPPNAGILRSN